MTAPASDEPMARYDRPSTEGCTELSCMYHGEDNRRKRLHAKDCPVWSYKGGLGFGGSFGCTCGATPAADGSLFEGLRED